MHEAFAFGEEYCRVVTASNPPPVQLKLEKVYGAVSSISPKWLVFTFTLSHLHYCIVEFAANKEEVLRDDVRICQSKAARV